MTIITNPTAIQAFAVRSQIAMVHLESKGMTHSCGAAKPRICKSLGISTRTPHAKVIEVLKTKLSELEAQL